MSKIFKQDKGVAGLSILLGVIVTLFIIGLLVTIFAIMGTEMRDSIYTSTLISYTNKSTVYKVNETGVSLTGTGLRNVACATPSSCVNLTDGVLVPAVNYSLSSGCLLKYTGTNTAVRFNNTIWNCTYSYTYDADNTATNIMNETVTGIAGVSDWFDIFIVITAMVVLILLTVIIITAIRGSGMIGTTGGQNSVGTA
jgi:hypothetical protein